MTIWLRLRERDEGGWRRTCLFVFWLVMMMMMSIFYRQIIDLAKEAEDRARLLVGTAEQLADEVEDPGAGAARRAARRCGHAAQGLRACAQVRWLPD